MKFFSLPKLLLLLPAVSQAFLALRPRSSAATGALLTTNRPFPLVRRRMANSEKDEKKLKLPDLPDLPDMSEVMKSFDINKVLENADQIRDNVFAGEFGSRGEAYVLAQAVLLVCIAIGGVPLVGDILLFLIGPVLFLSGAATILLGVQGLGAALSPWPVTSNKTTGLTQDGAYSQVRHPIYAGLLASCAGLSIVTGSATRLLLTVLLWYVLNEKSKFEEAELTKSYPDYPAYKQKVNSKFVPVYLLEILPWIKQEENSEE
jgi:protein-S-isoprenylcysteine O-methyltransferase Ste14